MYAVSGAAALGAIYVLLLLLLRLRLIAVCLSVPQAAGE